ncbi:MAG: hypothetical protein R3D67_18235 [Hyphomicrobiaceae bacterium]
MVVASALADPQARLLERFRSGRGETAFVPGLYRMLAHWPGLLAHFAVVLAPHFRGGKKNEAAERILSGSRDIVAALRGLVVSVDGVSAPGAEEALHLRGMIEGYRVTSPEMILFGQLIDEALPSAP